MPRDPNGVMTLPASTWVQTGDTVLPVQHNSPFRDIENALTNSIDRDGRTVMTGPLQMGGNKVTNVAPGTNDSDALNVLQLRDRVDAVADFATVSDLLADNNQRIGYAGSGARVIVAPGQITTAQGFRYEVKASADDAFLETAGGVKVECVSSVVSIEAYGADKDTWDEDAVRAALRTKRVPFIEGPGWDGDPTPTKHIVIYCDPVNGDDANLGDAATPVQHIQEALDRLPRSFEGLWIEVNCADALSITLPVTYDEDVRFGPFTGGGTGSAGEGNLGKITIRGYNPDRTKCEMGSFVAFGCVGPKVGIMEGWTMLRSAPDDGNEGAAIQAHNCNEIGVNNVGFADNGIKRGILSYTSIMDVRDVDAANITDHVLAAKRSGKITHRNVFGNFNRTDSAFNEGPYECREGSEIVGFNENITYGSFAIPGGVVGGTGGGIRVIDVDKELSWSTDFKFYGVVASATRTTNVSSNSSGLAGNPGLQEVITDNRGQVDIGNNRINIFRDGIYKLSFKITAGVSSLTAGDAVTVRIKDGDGTILAEETGIYAGTSSAVTKFSVSVSTYVEWFGASGTTRRAVPEVVVNKNSGSGTVTFYAGRQNFEFSAEKLG